jgi:hypothetical protein
MLRSLTWLLVPLGLGAGVALGLFLAWGSWAPRPVQDDMSYLRRPAKEQYLRLVAAAYAADGDFQSARTRLARLRAGNAPQWVADQALQAERAGDQEDARLLARLAYALGITDPNTLRLAALPTPTPPPTSPAGAAP